MTIADKHKGGLEKHPVIEAGMGTPSCNNMMIFCCAQNNFQSFKYVHVLVKAVKQYKMLCSWEADPSSKSKKRRKRV